MHFIEKIFKKPLCNSVIDEVPEGTKHSKDDLGNINFKTEDFGSSFTPEN